MSNNQPKHYNKTIHMAEAPKGWLNKKTGKVTPFSEMSVPQLQRAKIDAQVSELFYHNKASVYGQLVDEIEDEATKRSIELRDHNTQFHANRRTIKNSRPQGIKG